MVASLRRSSLVELATQTLTEQLAAGTWPVGTALPGETTLAEQLGVGRSTLREAVRALVQAGMLEARQGVGTFVRSTSPQLDLAAIARKAAVYEVYEAREAIEVQAGILAARRRTDEDLVALEAACAARHAAAEHRYTDPAAFADVDLAFHRLVVQAAHNDLLLGLFDSLNDVARPAVMDLVGDDMLGESSEEAWVREVHDDLVEAIRNRDEHAAVRATAGHLSRTLSVLYGEAAEQAAP